MNKNDHVIVINGRRYNVKTGENLSHPDEPVRIVAASIADKPTTPVRHTASLPTQKPARKPARHAAAHAPKPANTLMRQAVKKPPASLKRRLRVQGRIDSQIKQPQVKTVYDDAFKEPGSAPARRHAAKGRLINHFSPSLFIVTVTQEPPAAERSLVSSNPIEYHATPPGRPAFAPRKPRNTTELLEYAIEYADHPREPEEPVRRRHGRRLLHRRVHAAAH